MIILCHSWSLWANLFWAKDDVHLRECCLALLNVLALGTRASLPTEVDSDAHEESALVEEVAGDVNAHQQQEKDNNEDAYDGSGSQAWATVHGTWRARTGRGDTQAKQAGKKGEEEELGERKGFNMKEKG